MSGESWGALLAGKLDHRDMNVYRDVAVQGVHFGNSGMTIALTYIPLVRKPRDAEIMYGNLLCLSLDGSFQVPLWGVVVGRCCGSLLLVFAVARCCR